MQQVARYRELRSGCVYMELRAGCVIRASKYTRQYGKTRRCANVKQCKLKGWGVAVVDLWLFFEYHAEVKV